MYVRIMSKCNNRNIVVVGGGEVETCEKTRNVILKECPPSYALLWLWNSAYSGHRSKCG